MGLKIADQLHGPVHTLRINRFSIGLTADQAAQVQNERQSGGVAFLA
jgi:hypothetical protein